MILGHLRSDEDAFVDALEELDINEVVEEEYADEKGEEEVSCCPVIMA